MTNFDPYSAQKAAEATCCARTAAEKAAFAREEAAITSYEEGWDDWDGPIWPKGTVQVVLRFPAAEEKDGTKTPDTQLGDH
ncbi:hypothetical protein BU16DRAFT_562809 [Lophium mytilinum]|uniref:Uncharacterized protein n=1 Tax=Lophium mytilinum TaxID=390894 RepID=A0A6A6QSH7_9PEZI|nr:hypothetical protein BU16DRAFT_562809 [Lophium mytilinum]